MPASYAIRFLIGYLSFEKPHVYGQNDNKKVQ